MVEWETATFFGLMSIEATQTRGKCLYVPDNNAELSVIAFPSIADAEEAIDRLKGVDINGQPVTLELAAVCIIILSYSCSRLTRRMPDPRLSKVDPLLLETTVVPDTMIDDMMTVDLDTTIDPDTKTDLVTMTDLDTTIDETIVEATAEVMIDGMIVEMEDTTEVMTDETNVEMTEGMIEEMIVEMIEGTNDGMIDERVCESESTVLFVDEKTTLLLLRQMPLEDGKLCRVVQRQNILEGMNMMQKVNPWFP